VLVRRLSLADLYNFSMNSVDRADQLRHYYRPDGLWFRMRKWWWSVFLWALGQAKVNAYVAYVAVCKGAGKKPMTHLDFHVAIVTAWCTTPELVLKYECKGGPKAASTPAANEGVRGERDAGRAAEAASKAAAAEAAKAAEAAEATGSPGAAAAATPGPRQAGDKATNLRKKKSPPSGSSEGTPGPNAGAPKMNDAKHQAAIASYGADPGAHKIDFVPQGAKKVNCQVCGTGRGMRAPKERHQTAAIIQCMGCKISVCGPGCWKLLHGYYKPGEEPTELPNKFKGGKKKAGADDDKPEEVAWEVVSDDD
jgi:hypothetical protein